MRGTARMEFEELLHHMALLGVAAFGVWLLIGAMGFSTGYIQVAQAPAIRFMTAILVLMMPHVLYPDIKELRFRQMSGDERAGFVRRRIR